MLPIRHTYIANLHKVDKSGNLRRPPSFDGFLQTINAIKLIYSRQERKGYKFLLTNRLNQDRLENQFSIYRQRGGYSRNPTVRMFEASYKSNSIMNMMKAPKTSSYDVEDQSNNLVTHDFVGEMNIEDEEFEPSTSSSFVYSTSQTKIME